MTKKIIDVSYANTVTDWMAVGEQVDGVVIRIGYRGYNAGTIKPDANFHKHLQGALGALLPVGFYFMSQAVNEEEAEQEAKYCHDQLINYSMMLPDCRDIQIYYDSEYSNDKKTGRADKLTKHQRTEICKAFCRRIEEYDYRAGVYASKSWYQTHLDVSELTGYILWVAQYNSTYTAGHRADLWQYTSAGQITGICGKVDISECYIPFGEGSGTAPAKPAQAQQTEVTEKQVREKIVAVMRGWIGLKKSDKSHAVIIDTYNSFTPLARGYKVTYQDAYCAATVSAAAIRTGYTDIMPIECSCRKLIEQAQRMGIWVENDAYMPEPADLILYDWQDWADFPQTDNKGEPDHVGMVEKIRNNTITIIEGNMSGGIVGRRTVAINGRYIRGYICPHYESKADGNDKEQGTTRQSGYDCPYKEPTYTLYQGQVGTKMPEYTRWLQWQLVRLGFLPAKNEKGQDNIDGVFGRRTATAVYVFQSEFPETYTTDTPDLKIGPLSRKVLKSL